MHGYRQNYILYHKKMFQFLLILVFCFMNSAKVNFTLQDLELVNGSCHHLSTCQEPTQSCNCDDACVEYGDCCLQANRYDPELMADSGGRYECISVPSFNRSVYMKGNCKVGWENRQVDTLCQKGYYMTSYENQTKDHPIFDTPYTSLVTNVTYKNYYCAVCNGESLADIVTWNTKFICFFSSTDEYENIDSSYLLENSFSVNNTFVVEVNNSDGESKDHECKLQSVIPETLTDKIRICQKHVATCSSNWTNLEIQNLCHSYKILVNHQDVIYRNVHCAQCNYVSDNINCNSDPKNTSQAPLINSLFTFLNYTYENCFDGQILHPYSKECVNISNIEMNTTLNCSKKSFINVTDYYKGPRLRIIINSTQQTYEDEKYDDDSEGIWVCDPEDGVDFMAWFTLIGLGMSIVCLILHLLVFLYVPDLRNINDKNIASLCLALLVAYVCFLNNNDYFEVTNVGCKVLASFTYYFFLASLVWMNVISFDIWLALQLASSKLRVSSGRQLKKFIFYSIYAWTIPGFALLSVILIDSYEPTFVPDNYRPLLGSKEIFCWFGQGDATLIYFYIPLAVVMTLNIIFFALSVTVTTNVKSNSSLSACQPHALHLKLYWKLAVLMGIGWVSGMVSGYYPDNPFATLLFILMNAFQGVYIFLAYTCTKKVRKSLKKSILRKMTTRKVHKKNNQNQRNITNQDSFELSSSTPSVNTTTSIFSTSSF